MSELVRFPRSSPEPFVDAKELARLMGVSKRTVVRWQGEGMPSVVWGQRARRFLPSQCMAWARAEAAAKGHESGDNESDNTPHTRRRARP